jgi:hypothetical protein
MRYWENERERKQNLTDIKEIYRSRTETRERTRKENEKAERKRQRDRVKQPN